MKSSSKILAVLFSCAFAVAMLAGCGAAGGFTAKDLVQGNLDVIYLDKASPDYLKAVKISAEEAHQDYLNGLAAESEYLADLYDIDFSLAGDAAYNEAIDLLGKIYQHSKYEVGSATKNGDANVVSVTIHPMNIYYDFQPDLDAIHSDWLAKYENNEFASEADAEAAWAHAIIQGLSKHVDPMTYQSPQTIQVQVVQDPSDGLYTISDNDFSRIDTPMLAY